MVAVMILLFELEEYTDSPILSIRTADFGLNDPFGEFNLNMRSNG